MITFAALAGQPVTEAHARHCRDHGHATHTINGVGTGVCPRCGDVIEPTGKAAMTTVSPEEFYCEYIRALERVETGTTTTDEALQLLAVLYGANPGLRADFSDSERDLLAGHLIRSVVNGTLDEYARADLAKTRSYLDMP